MVFPGATSDMFTLDVTPGDPVSLFRQRFLTPSTLEGAREGPGD